MPKPLYRSGQINLGYFSFSALSQHRRTGDGTKNEGGGMKLNRKGLKRRRDHVNRGEEIHVAN